MPTEEQTSYNENETLGSADFVRVGQRLFIANRTITNLFFPLFKGGSPTGDVTFTIRAISDDHIINSKVWGDASALPTEITWEEVTLVPITIDEEVYILAEFSEGDAANWICCGYQGSDVKAGELFTRYDSSYGDDSRADGAYIYTYTAVAHRHHPTIPTEPNIGKGWR